MSCSSQSNQEKKLVLTETKNEIKTHIDSANYYYDLVISGHNQGMSNSTLIKKYGRRIEKIETEIDQALEKINKLGKEGKLTEREYEDWKKEFDLSLVMEKHKKVKNWGIDFTELPITNSYSLTQSYNDSINHFTINFPADWTIMPNYNQFTLMGAGPLKTDSLTPMKRDGGFGLDINKYDREVTTDEYYNGNLNSIKKGYTKFKILEEKNINLNGISAKYVAHQALVNGKEIVSIQIYFTKSKSGYILNGSATSESYESYRDLYIEISRTFRLNNKTII